MGRRLRGRPLLAALVAATVAALWASPAHAHVSVTPSQVAPGSFATLTFRVPNERADASTVSLRLVVPTAAPINSAAVHKLAGWRAEVERVPLDAAAALDAPGTDAVSAVTWTALDDAAAVDGNQFQEFRVSLGPLPQSGERLIFKALQTYSDGQVSRWIEEPASDGTEPANPAVVVYLDQAAAVGVDEHGMPIPGGAPSGDIRSPAAALGIGIAALVVAVAALLLGLLNRALGTRRPR
ncbi:YcnI family copper-binding membrane protein [Verrucosispora sioxanthis]|uniref:YcnI family protein n=1 Tax=Verrucosispora sioxanthis TaxID=2499994 RepID=A0A6M1KWJ9_9ACTN|nr:YcnI family protein [Verrucosispora sioxanthis]NEE64445.1 YcnI family protein [Verrucosispora sioxanthis]NGM13555.1 YcnI family protein [Verrucosispora sioxanthis]